MRVFPLEIEVAHEALDEDEVRSPSPTIWYATCTSRSARTARAIAQSHRQAKGRGQSLTANSRQLSGTPLSSCSPRGSNSIPDPATRSLTVLDTRISRRLRQRRHPLADVHRQPADVVTADLDLAGVQADPDLETEIGSRVPDGGRAPDRPRRPVERGEETVARRLHLAAAERLELLADGCVVVVEEVLPAAVAERSRPLGRARRRR